MGRFLMNVMLTSSGYTLNVVRVRNADGCMATVEKASAEGGVNPFAQLHGRRVGARSP